MHRRHGAKVEHRKGKRQIHRTWSGAKSYKSIELHRLCYCCRCYWRRRKTDG
uniref:Nucleolar complex protein 4 homolog B n=1 Tax=Rhizophora mucronata TaxID=61149 RepID=A0A2P2M9Q3_RHIMU